VFCLTVVLLVFALNLSGLFEVGLYLTGAGSSLSSQSGMAGSFFSGVLATVVATPCAAPLLAPALGAALTLKPAASILVFSFVALGLSTPYLFLSIFPGLVRALPRPGAWMESFKQAMAFLLYATVAYLVWVLAGQLDEKAFLYTLFALVLVAAGLWIYGRWAGPARRVPVRRIAMTAAAVFFLSAIYLGYASQQPSEIDWEPWSRARVEELRAEGRPVYVDFTARWCATCQVNKRLVFASKGVVREFLDRTVATLKADWTNSDPEITRALARFGRSAVPFNILYVPGTEEPVILPEILTPGIVLEALDRL